MCMCSSPFFVPPLPPSPFHFPLLHLFPHPPASLSPFESQNVVFFLKEKENERNVLVAFWNRPRELLKHGWH